MGFLRIERVFVLEKTCTLHQGRSARFRLILVKMTPPLSPKHFTSKERYNKEGKVISSTVFGVATL